MDKQAAEATRE